MSACKRTVTQADLRKAHRLGFWTIDKPSAFYLVRGHLTGLLGKPSVVVKAGTTVHVAKVYRRGRAALLSYIDRSGKVWWSWTHATEYETKAGRNLGGTEPKEVKP